MKSGITRDEPPAGSAGAAALIGRLISEESRLAVGAKLHWAQYAQQQIAALAQRESDARA
jgi:hypothetical protein